MHAIPTTASTAQSDAEPSPVSSLVVTFLPLFLIVAIFVLFLRVARRSTTRAEEAMRLYREMLGELRAIRAAIEAERGTGH